MQHAKCIYTSIHLKRFTICTEISAAFRILCLTFIKYVSSISSHYFFCDHKSETHKGIGFYFYVTLMKCVRYGIKQRVYLLTEQSIVQPHCFYLASHHIVQFQTPCRQYIILGSIPLHKFVLEYYTLVLYEVMRHTFRPDV